MRGLVFINPGNPTGQCLSRDNLEALIKFAYNERVALMCDRRCRALLSTVAHARSVKCSASVLSSHLEMSL